MTSFGGVNLVSTLQSSRRALAVKPVTQARDQAGGETRHATGRRTSRRRRATRRRCRSPALASTASPRRLRMPRRRRDAAVGRAPAKHGAMSSRIVRAAAAAAVAILAMLAIPATPSSATTYYEYWSYWHKAPGASSWQYSSVGPSGYYLKQGTQVEGWRFALGTASPSDPKPRPTSVSYDQYCANKNTDKSYRVLLVVDYGTQSSAPGGPVYSCYGFDDAVTGYRVLTQQHSERDSGGLICAIDGYPARGAVRPRAVRHQSKRQRQHQSRARRHNQSVRRRRASLPSTHRRNMQRPLRRSRRRSRQPLRWCPPDHRRHNRPRPHRRCGRSRAHPQRARRRSRGA